MTTMTNPGSPPTTRRRRSRTVRRLVITLVVLLGLLVVADFAAAAVFEHEVSKRARAHFGLADDPSVRVGGFSFLLQATSGEYDHVDVKAKGVPVKDVLRDVEVEAELRGVHAPLSELLSGSTRGVRVDETKATVLVKASDVNRAITQNENEVLRTFTRLTIDPVSEKVATTEPPEGSEPETLEEAQERDDTTAGVRLCGTADVVDASTDLCVFGIISLVDAKITFAPKRLEIRNALTSGSLPPQIQSRVLAPFERITLDPGQLPFTVTPTAVKVDPGRLSVTGTARNVVLSGAGG